MRVFGEGMMAFRAKTLREACPYPESEDRDEWLAGWDKAAEFAADDARDDAMEETRPGHGAECCRYLSSGKDGWGCFKHARGDFRTLDGKVVPSVASYIDQRVAAGEMHARGDNCEGFPPEKEKAN